MNHLRDCFQHWHCASRSRQAYLLLCGIAILRWGLHWLDLWISNTVGNRDLVKGCLGTGHGQVYMPHKVLWGNFKVPLLVNGCLDDQFRSASFDLLWLTSWVSFTGHTSMVDGKWEWKIYHWLIKSTRHSLPLLRRQSIIIYWPGTQRSLGSCQSLVEEMEHIVTEIQETLITWVIMHA